eukprot:m.318866 g.318866  ORF g.318866 m.318866 type:complete len:50 (+) comp15990_c0_seq38:4551-4700(+)
MVSRTGYSVVGVTCPRLGRSGLDSFRGHDVETQFFSFVARLQRFIEQAA